ncbi:MAG: hypothetical protein Q7T44_08340 [Parvibaculum sp.]|nr:hypothetical protein [Parvibaculum sp.]
MARGIPALLSGDNEAPISTLRSISFARDDLACFDETLLQRVVDQTPEILPIRDFYPAVSSVCSLGREIPVDLGERQGFIDNLLVTNDGHLVLVETKLHRNPEAVRDVIIQTLQYGMAVNNMPLLELESRARRGDRNGTLLRNDETIRARVFGQVDQGLMTGVPDNFEEALERYMRTGEILLLVVADGIHTSVERITHWMNKSGRNSPTMFGMVELRFYELPDGQRVIIPKTLLKTREISRHVVVVDIRNETPATTTATVTDELQIASGGKTKESRPVKAASVPLTKTTLLELVPAEAHQAAALVIEQLEALQFGSQGTNSTLKFGFTSDNGEFHAFVALDKFGAWVGPLKKDADRLGYDAVLDFRKGVNQFGSFYREDQMVRPDSFGCAVKYRQLAESARAFATFLDGYRSKLMELLGSVEC